MTARVLFVSKPIAPPFHDGTKCLVRDVARELERIEPLLMSTRASPSIVSRSGKPIQLLPVYSDAGSFSPALIENARAAAWLLRADADLRHFVFAPNPASSRFARWLCRVKRVPVLQTVASPPRRFARPDKLLFGEIVVTQSEWCAERLRESWEREGLPPARLPRLEVISPPVPALEPRSRDACAAVRRLLEIPESAKVFVYPGDLETSGGAEAVARAVPELIRELPDAVVVFAYRAKTPRAPEIAERLSRRLDRRHVRFAAALPDVLSLIATSRVVLFPVDDLWGKVDLPIVLLEAMVLGVPVVALDWGPLRELGGVVHTPPGDVSALVRRSLELDRDAGLRGRVIMEQSSAVEDRHRAPIVARRYEALYFDLLGRGRVP